MINANRDQIVMVAQVSEEKSTEEHMVEYIQSLQAIEEAMEPFKEQKRELKENYKDNAWLSKEDMSMAVKAYRLLRNDTDLSTLIDMCNSLKTTVKVVKDES